MYLNVCACEHKIKLYGSSNNNNNKKWKENNKTYTYCMHARRGKQATNIREED